jgi:hypothetical protein
MNLPRRFSRLASVLAIVSATAIAQRGDASIILSGDIATTGGTLTLTEDISFNIEAGNAVRGLAFENWVTTYDGTRNTEPLTPSSFRYTIDFGSEQTAMVNSLRDNYPTGEISNTDGYILLTNSFPVSAGQTLTIVAQSWTMGASTTFNPQAIGTFTGDVFLFNNDAERFATTTAVPEPSTWAAFSGLGALGFVMLRRRRRRIGRNDRSTFPEGGAPEQPGAPLPCTGAGQTGARHAATASMADDKHTPADPPRPTKAQVDSTRTSDKPRPSAKVVQGQNAEEEPKPGNPDPGEDSATPSSDKE